MSSKGESQKTNNRVLLSVCIAIAAFIWFINKLSQNTPWSLRTNIQYEIKEGYVISKENVKQLTVKLEGSGWSLWRISNDIPEAIQIQAEAKIGNQNWSYDQLKQIVQQQYQLSDEIDIASITPPRIVLTLEEASSKCVPVQLPLDLEFLPSFDQLGPIELTPDSVCLTGPSNILKSIKKILLDTLSLQSVSTQQKGTLSLEKHVLTLLRADVAKIDYSIQVSEYTEFNKYIDLRVIYSGKDSIEIFPKSALVSMNVPISKYDETKASGIGLYVQIPDQVDAAGNTAQIQAARNLPSWLKVKSIQPREVEYFFLESTVDTLIEDSTNE